LPHRSAATRHSYSTYKTFKEHSVMGNWIGLPGHVQNSVIADVNIHSLQWLDIHEQIRRDGGLAVHARTAIDYSRRHYIFLVSNTSFSLYDFCNMLHVQSAVEGTAPPSPSTRCIWQRQQYTQEPTYMSIHTAIRKEWVSNPVEPLRLQTRTYLLFLLTSCKNWKTDTRAFWDYLEITIIHVK